MEATSGCASVFRLHAPFREAGLGTTTRAMSIMDIYNEAWAGKWGWVPVTPAELDKMAEDLSLVLDPEIVFIAEVNGEPAGMCIMVPNLNEVIADMSGALFPFNWAKLLYRTKVKRPKSTRLIPHPAQRARERAQEREALRGPQRRDVRRGRAPRHRAWVRMERAVVDARRRRADQPRDPVDGREGLQDVSGVREGALRPGQSQ